MKVLFNDFFLDDSRQEIGENAIWSVSTAKSGSGVKMLRSDDFSSIRYYDIYDDSF